MEICRLCLDAIIGIYDFRIKNTDARDMVLVVLPEVNLEVSSDPAICFSCKTNLKDLYSFKSSLKSVQTSKGEFCNKSSDKQMQIYKNQPCELCDINVESADFITIKPDDCYLNNMLLTCLPECKINYTNSSIMCKKCLKDLQNLNDFRNVCLESENRIKLFIDLDIDKEDSNFSNKYIDLQNVVDFYNKNIKKEISENDQFEEVHVKVENSIENKYMEETNISDVDDMFSEGETEQSIESFDNKYEAVFVKRELTESSDDSSDDTLNKYECSISNNSNNKSNKKESRCSRKHDGRIHKCKKCDFRTKCKPSFRSHIKLAHECIEVFACDICGLITKYKHNLSQHIKKVHQNEVTIYDCSYCEFSSIHKGSFNAHVRANHVKNPTLYKCPQCNFETKYKRWIKPHIMKVHEKVVNMFECQVCDYKTTRKNTLKSHVYYEHEGGEPFKCNECKYTTRNKSNLVKHLRYTHRADMPMFACPYCVYETKRKDDLRKHIKKMHSEKIADDEFAE